MPSERKPAYMPRSGETPAGPPKWNSDPYYVELSRRHFQKQAQEATEIALRQLGIIRPEDATEERQEDKDA